MKVITLVILVAALAAGTVLYKPAPGEGALLVFKNKVKIHESYDFENSNQAYVNLMFDMGVCKNVRGVLTSIVIYSSDEFGIYQDSIGYYPVILRNHQMVKGLKKVYLNKRIKNARDEKIQPVHVSESGEPASFPKTLRKGAGDRLADQVYVKTVQQKLVDKGYTIPISGIFDEVTEHAVMVLLEQERNRYYFNSWLKNSKGTPHKDAFFLGFILV